MPREGLDQNYAKSEYQALTDPDRGQKGPNRLTEEDGKLYRNGTLLVPESRVLGLCEAWHHHMMQPGAKRQALDMQRRFQIDEIGLYNAIKQVMKGCSVCQACNPDNRNVKGEAQRTPIPDQPMESVVMYVFSMPKVHCGKEVLDCVVLCMDQHSGYIVAVRARKKGLLAKEVAAMMIRHWLTVFSVPRTICSDRGPHFSGGWFKAMCFLMRMGMPRVAPISAGPMAEPKWLEGSCSTSCARSSSPKSAATGLRRCGQLLRPIMTLPQRVACHPTRFFSARTTWVGDFPCQVMAWQWMPRSSWCGKRIRRVRLARSSRRSTPCEPRPPRSPQRIGSGWVTRFRYRDPSLWALTALRPGSHPPTVSRWAPDSSGSDMKVSSVSVSLMSRGDMCPWTTPPMKPTQTATMLNKMTTPS